MTKIKNDKKISILEIPKIRLFRISLIFGALTCVGGSVGVLSGTLISQVCIRKVRILREHSRCGRMGGSVFGFGRPRAPTRWSADWRLCSRHRFSTSLCFWSESVWRLCGWVEFIVCHFWQNFRKIPGFWKFLIFWKFQVFQNFHSVHNTCPFQFWTLHFRQSERNIGDIRIWE